MKRTIFAATVFVTGIILSLYVGGWLLFVKPIITCCMAFDIGCLTATMVGISVVKVVLAGIVSSVVLMICAFISSVIMDDRKGKA